MRPIKASQSETLSLKKPPQPRRTLRGERRRLSLLDTAREVFLEHGFDGASIEEIMRRVGGSKASLYSYFGSKEGLFFEILAAQSEDFVHELRIPEQADGDVEKTLRDIGRRFLRAMLDERSRGMFRIMIAEAPRLPPSLVQSYYERGPLRGREAFARYLTQLHEAGRLEIANPEAAAAHFFELVKGLPHTRILLGLKPFAAGASAEQHVRSAVKFFLYGCTPRS